MSDKKVMLISYQFCPKGQIGTRRWSKFAKYLSRNNYEVYVISAEYPYKDKVNWCHDVANNPNIKIIRLPSRSPQYVLQPERTFGVKLLDRILKNSIYWQDYSQYWGAVLAPKVIEVVRKEGIKKVIATGAPFSVLYQAAKIKNHYPDINLMLDFRDPWTTRLKHDSWWSRLVYNQATKQEKFAIEHADHIFLTTVEHRTTYGRIYPQAADKMSVLRNGYDEDDFQDLNTTEKTGFCFIYTGALMTDRLAVLVNLLEAVLLLGDESLLAELRIDVFGPAYKTPTITDPKVNAIYHQTVNYCGLLSQREVFQKINEYRFCLAINEPQHNQIIPAKTYDYMGLKKTIFAISPPGPLSVILAKHGQYCADFTVSSIATTLRKLYDDYKSGQIAAFGQTYQAYSYGILTTQLIQQMEADE